MQPVKRAENQFLSKCDNFYLKFSKMVIIKYIHKSKKNLQSLPKIHYKMQ